MKNAVQPSRKSATTRARRAEIPKDRHRGENLSRLRLGGSLAQRVASLAISWRQPCELQYHESQSTFASGAHRSDPQVSQSGSIGIIRFECSRNKTHRND